MTVPAHLDPTRRHDFVFLFDVCDGNPNGDPDAGGAPRVDIETGAGLVTDVAVKRKIRNTITLLNPDRPGYEIYVEAGVSLNSQHERAYHAKGLDFATAPTGEGEAPAAENDNGKGRGKTKPKQDIKDALAKSKQAQEWMCSSFYDVRLFGAVMSTGRASAGRVRGPMQLTFSRSIDPVMPQEIGITRITRTQEDAFKETEMGSKHIIHYGLYRGIGHFSAPLAKRTGVTSDDLDAFWRAMTLMYDHDYASSRGQQALRGLYIFTHADGLGTAPAHTLTDRVQATRIIPDDQPIRSINDYKIEIRESGLPDGVTLTTLIG